MCPSKRFDFDKGGWKPVLGNYRKIGTNGGNGKPISDGNYIGNKQIFTLFVDNLPEDVSQRWVRCLFNKFGVVKDVYIPGKRSKVTGKIFGFVRYDCEVSADMAISKANGLWIEDSKLFVKLAYFDQIRGNNDQRQIIPNKTLTGNTTIDLNTSHRVEVSTKGNVAGSASYVNAVKGVIGGKGSDKRMKDGSVQEEHKLCLKAEGNGWLYRSAVAKLHRLISIDELKDQMAGMGVDNVLVRAMGGRSVILTCNNNEELENLLKVSCLQRWFSEIKSWEGQADCIERFVWLCCYGIPLNGWSNTSFKAIGELWGTFISTDEPTLKLSSFAIAKVLVATNVFEEIDEWINIEIEGKSYRVKVMEDPCDQPFEAERQIPRDSLGSSQEHDEDVSKDNEDDDKSGDNASNLDPKMDRDCDSKDGVEKDDTLLSGGADLRLFGDNFVGVNLGVAGSESSESSPGSEDGVIGAKGAIPILETGITHDSHNSLRASQVEGINLHVDLNQKEGSSRCNTQSFEEYCQRREASHSEDYGISSGRVDVVEELPRQKSNNGSNIPGIRSSSDAILKMRRGVRRSERKIKKKKHLAEIEAKFDKMKHNNKKSSYSSVFFKEARKMLDVGKALGIEIKGGRNYNLKRFVEMQEEELKERIHALDEFEEEDISEDDVGLEEDASLSMAF